MAKPLSLDPLLQSWYRKKELVVLATEPLGDVLFSAVGIAFGVQFKIKRGAQLPACANGLHTMQDNPAAGAVGAFIARNTGK